MAVALKPGGRGRTKVPITVCVIIGVAVCGCLRVSSRDESTGAKKKPSRPGGRPSDFESRQLSGR